MATNKIKDFFNGRFFEIPKYQRGYAWDISNVRELFEDIFESTETKSNHYLGTIVLSKSDDDDELFYIVDGQQRVATLTMIFNAIIQHLSGKDSQFFHRFYIQDEKFRLKPLGKDMEFFSALLKDENPSPQNKSQRLMQDAYEEIQNTVAELDNRLNFLKSVEKLELMEFIENSEGDAIRIFQTVNDRGKPLSNMEKAKSLLVYFSNRYLDKKLDDKINNLFGEIFEIYDDIKHISEEIGINLIKSVDFNEDNIMRYHFVTYSDENYDATASYVLNYLKNNLSKFRSEDKEANYHNMEIFIEQYIESLRCFFDGLKDILERSLNDEQYYKLFVILGLSATLYPLVVKLKMIDILDDNLPDDDYCEVTFLDLIEIIDVRVYKTRGTDPRAQISKIAYEIDKNSTDKEIQDWLLWFNQRWMSKEEFQTNLYGYIYRNRALPHIFIDYCEELQKSTFDLQKLKKIVSKQPTIEHILSQKPKFSYHSQGFNDEEDFLEYEDTLGNLTILEKNINSAVQNKNPIDKVPHYDKSLFKMTKRVSSNISKNREYKKADIKRRTKEIADYCAERWWAE